MQQSSSAPVLPGDVFSDLVPGVGGGQLIRVEHSMPHIGVPQDALVISALGVARTVKSGAGAHIQKAIIGRTRTAWRVARAILVASVVVVVLHRTHKVGEVGVSSQCNTLVGIVGLEHDYSLNVQPIRTRGRMQVAALVLLVIRVEGADHETFLRQVNELVSTFTGYPFQGCTTAAIGHVLTFQLCDRYAAPRIGLVPILLVNGLL
mmetsp:Transcript_4071/g.8197  ORF Transcript_4071/g.8197 Transcript_4071/m.8197 type:complete len:206 (+) Transcript_4071:529-1146(+)